MKLIFKLIKIAIIFVFIGCAFLLLINKTFIYEAYKGPSMDSDGVSIPRFMYVVENRDTLNAKFYTILSINDLNKSRDSYLNTLEKCYNKYYYDKSNNITITKYEIDDKKYYKEVILNYESGNLCSQDYVLSDMWVYEYISLSGYVSGDITEASMTKLIDKIYNSKRIDVLTDSVSEIEINVECDNNRGNYTLTFKDYGDNALLVIRYENNETRFAVYEVEDVKNYLRSLE